MLVLSRKPGERIRMDALGIEIEVVVLESTYSHVRLGIEAPLAVSVLRSELINRRREGAPAEAGTASSSTKGGGCGS